MVVVDIEEEGGSPCCGAIDDEADADVALAIPKVSSGACCVTEAPGMSGRGKIGRESGGIFFTFLDGLLVLLLPDRVVAPP